MIEGDRLLTEEDRLIVALDVPDEAAALRLVDALRGLGCRFKVGLQLFAACGPDIVRKLAQRGAKLFLDLKLHDIPNTVEHAMAAAVQPGVFLADVHAGGGRRMLEAAVAGAEKSAAVPRPLVVGVTVLTHLEAADLAETGVADAPEAQVVRLARLCEASGLDGVVASPREIRAIRDACRPGFVIVTPGIRPAGHSPDDQARVATPTAALRAGAGFLVVGRPIVAAPDPAEAAARIVREMKDAFLIA